MATLRPGTAKEAGLSAEPLEALKKRCQEWIDDGTHPSLAVLVARHGVIAMNEAFGRFGPQPDASPLTTDAIFPIASVTKTFTATALMMLVEDGLVGLTRPVAEYIPALTGEGKDEMCVHHLLTHTSGIRDIEVMEHVVSNWETADMPSPPEGVNPSSYRQNYLAAGAPLWKRPGEVMCYSNVNYGILGEIVRVASGRSLRRFAQNRIFGPLGMTDTTFAPPEDSARTVTRSADWELQLPDFIGPGSAFGGMFSTTVDTAKFAQAILNGGSYDGERILSRHGVREMTRNQIPGVGAWLANRFHKEASWGYGFGIGSNEKWDWFPAFPVGSFGHAGGTGTIFNIDPRTELIYVFYSTALARRDANGELQGLVWNADLFVNLVQSALDG